MPASFKYTPASTFGQRCAIAHYPKECTSGKTTAQRAGLWE
tara:strand:- start:301 stop:423 length:123 start_codon:yes stop_codon:yes gene_type:complete